MQRLHIEIRLMRYINLHQTSSHDFFPNKTIYVNDHCLENVLTVLLFTHELQQFYNFFVLFILSQVRKMIPVNLLRNVKNGGYSN